MYKKSFHFVVGLIAMLLSGGVYAESRLSFEPEMVKLPNGKWMGKYEVTQAQWEAVMGSNPSIFKKCGSNCPVENVSWDDVQIFISKLNEKTGKNYYLPTEKEWFKACQAGKKNKYCGSNDINSVAWYWDNSNKTTHPVGKRQANNWGLYDMSGNVWEWTISYYDAEKMMRSFRGSSWFFTPEDFRSANRNGGPSYIKSNFLGFRLSKK